MPLVNYQPFFAVRQLQDDINRLFSDWDSTDSSGVTADWVLRFGAGSEITQEERLDLGQLGDLGRQVLTHGDPIPVGCPAVEPGASHVGALLEDAPNLRERDLAVRPDRVDDPLLQPEERGLSRLGLDHLEFRRPGWTLFRRRLAR